MLLLTCGQQDSNVDLTWADWLDRFLGWEQHNMLFEYATNLEIAWKTFAWLKTHWVNQGHRHSDALVVIRWVSPHYWAVPYQKHYHPGHSIHGELNQVHKNYEHIRDPVHEWISFQDQVLELQEMLTMFSVNYVMTFDQPISPAELQTQVQQHPVLSKEAWPDTVFQKHRFIGWDGDAGPIKNTTDHMRHAMDVVETVRREYPSLIDTNELVL